MRESCVLASLNLVLPLLNLDIKLMIIKDVRDHRVFSYHLSSPDLPPPVISLATVQLF